MTVLKAALKELCSHMSSVTRRQQMQQTSRHASYFVERRPEPLSRSNTTLRCFSCSSKKRCLTRALAWHMPTSKHASYFAERGPEPLSGSNTTHACFSCCSKKRCLSRALARYMPTSRHASYFAEQTIVPLSGTTPPKHVFLVVRKSLA